MRACILIFLVIGLSIDGRAEDLRTNSGKVFRNFQVTGVGIDEIVIQHDGGLAKVPLKDLPAEIQKRFSAEQLFLQLQERNREIDRLQAELARITGQFKAKSSDVPRRASVPVEADRTSAVQAKPTPPIADLPLLDAKDIVEADDLIAHYKADRLAADRRYKNKTFKVRGRIEQFAPRLFLRTYLAYVESPDRYFRLACQFNYADDFKSVVARDNESRLTASLAGGGEKTLMRLGEAAVIKGTCVGIENNAIVLKGCERLP